MPVLEDKAAGVALPETSIIIEWLNDRFGGRLIPKDPGKALEVRLQDRFFDLYVHTPMGVFTWYLLRPEGQHDPYGVEQARTLLLTAYDMIERRMADREWAAGDDFSMADCAAAPALFYANLIVPFGGFVPLRTLPSQTPDRSWHSNVVPATVPLMLTPV